MVVGLAVYERPNHNEISKQNTSGQKTGNVECDEIQYVVHTWPSRLGAVYCGNEQQIQLIKYSYSASAALQSTCSPLLDVATEPCRGLSKAYDLRHNA